MFIFNRSFFTMFTDSCSYRENEKVQYLNISACANSVDRDKNAHTEQSYQELRFCNLAVSKFGTSQTVKHRLFALLLR